MSADSRPLRDLIRAVEAEDVDLDQKILASRIVAEFDEADTGVAAFSWVSDVVWGIRRDRQLRIEREASRERRAEWERQQQERRERERAEHEASRSAREAAAREAAEQEYERRRASADERFAPWLADLRLIPRDLLLGGRVAVTSNPRFGGRAGDAYEFRSWLLGSAAEHEAFKSLPEFPRITAPGARILLAACEAHAVPRARWSDVLMDWNFPSDALSVVIQQEIDAAAEAIRLELTADLLASVFALGDGVRVTWADATVEQHRQRAELTTANAVANAEDAARHLAAVRMIKTEGVCTLGELAYVGAVSGGAE